MDSRRLVTDAAPGCCWPASYRLRARPSGRSEKLLLGTRLRHGGHRSLTWMADNVELDEDAYGNAKPSKRLSVEKIDGIVALVMAIRRWQGAGPPQPIPQIW